MEREWNGWLRSGPLGNTLLVLLEALGQETLDRAPLDIARQRLTQDQRLLHHILQLSLVLLHLWTQKLHGRRRVRVAEPDARPEVGEIELQRLSHTLQPGHQNLVQLGAVFQQVLDLCGIRCVQSTTRPSEQRQEEQLALLHAEVRGKNLQHLTPHLLAVLWLVPHDKFQQQAIRLAHLVPVVRVRRHLHHVDCLHETPVRHVHGRLALVLQIVSQLGQHIDDLVRNIHLFDGDVSRLLEVFKAEIRHLCKRRHGIHRLGAVQTLARVHRLCRQARQIPELPL
mmetsp:Transcript_1056/g.3257  ORF Transcript_1056/g.3257 Transcript_1056/m.3257 type:complete len:283 (-) Transcript_1056:1021-1869(-)